MEKIESLQEKIDKTEYWDMKILDFQINFWGDEVSMWIYNDADTSWRVSFLSCYKVSYETDATWRASRTLSNDVAHQMTEIQNRDAKGKTISTYCYTYDLSGYILTESIKTKKKIKYQTMVMMRWDSSVRL